MRVERIHAGHILGTGAVLAPVFGVYAPHFMAPLAILVVGALLAYRAFCRQEFPSLDKPFALLAAAIIGWSGLSLIWTIDFGGAFEKWVAVFATAPLALIATAIAKRLPPAECRTVRISVLIGIAVGMILIALEAAAGGFISRFIFPDKTFTLELFNRLPSVLLIFIWPAVAVIWNLSRGAAMALLALGLATGFMLPSEAALAGFAIGVAVFAMSWFAPTAMRSVLAVSIALGILLSPAVTYTVATPDAVREAMPDVNPSLLHRLQIWDFTSHRIVERPLTGWGFNSARAIPGGNERYLVKNSEGRTIGQGDRLPLHPHNGALQVWLELGLPGALALAAFLVLAVLRAGSIPDRGQRAVALGMLSTMVPIWLFSFGVWQGWWLGVLILATLLMSVPLTGNRA